jgi:Zinc dependent phospholipase C
VLKEAARLAATKNAGWVRLAVALPHTDDPDTVFHDTYYHVYDVWGTHYGNAPKKVAEYYAKALTARKAGNWAAASRYVGIMSHYYADICNPMHTDQCAAEEAIHSSYESAAQDYTDSPGENRAWVRFNGYDPATSVAGKTKTTAAASHKQYTALVNGYVAGGMTSAVVSITAKSMNRAANGLADLIISLKRKVSGGTSAGGGGGSSGTTTVYITKTGSKYHRGSCSYLSQSKIAISLSQAKSRCCGNHDAYSRFERSRLDVGGISGNAQRCLSGCLC